MLFVLILITALILQFLTPWWIIVPIAFLLSFWKGERSQSSFWAGFFAIFILWILKGLLHTIPNDNLLANKVGQLFMLPDFSFNWIILLLITGLIGGLVAGLAAVAGFYTQAAFTERKRVPKTSK